MAKITQEELNRTLWAAADSSRGAVDGGVFKDYILTFLFFKYLSDKFKAEKSRLVEKYGKDSVRLKSKLAIARFNVPEDATFDYIYDRQTEDNIGELINKALHKILIG